MSETSMAITALTSHPELTLEKRREIATMLEEKDATIAQLRADVERLTGERQNENWWSPMERVMQRYPGFDWGDYQDGISEDDAANFFEADLQECWALVEKEKAARDKAEAALAKVREAAAQYMAVAVSIFDAVEIEPSECFVTVRVVDGENPRDVARVSLADTDKQLRATLTEGDGE